jgi:hypothetical protein
MIVSDLVEGDSRAGKSGMFCPSESFYLSHCGAI